jgi:hypothetical protein
MYKTQHEMRVQMGNGLSATLRDRNWAAPTRIPIGDPLQRNEWKINSDSDGFTNLDVKSLGFRVLEPGRASQDNQLLPQGNGTNIVIHCASLGAQSLYGRARLEADVVLKSRRRNGKFGPSIADADECDETGGLRSKGGISRRMRHFRFFFSLQDVKQLILTMLRPKGPSIALRIADGRHSTRDIPITGRASLLEPLAGATLRAAHLHKVGDDVLIMLILLAHRCLRGGTTCIYGYSAGTYTAVALHRAMTLVQRQEGSTHSKKFPIKQEIAKTTTIQTVMAAINFPGYFLRYICCDAETIVIHASEDRLSRVRTNYLVKSFEEIRQA